MIKKIFSPYLFILALISYAPALLAENTVVPKKNKAIMIKPICFDPSKDKEIVRGAISEGSLSGIYYNYEIMNYIDKRFLKDRQFILSTENLKIGYIDKSLSDDREVVLKMVKGNGSSLSYASKRLQKDKEIVLTALGNESRGSYDLIQILLDSDKDIILFAVSNNGYLLEGLSIEHKKDKEIVLAAVKNAGKALEFADASLQKDRDVVLAAVKNTTIALEFADPLFLTDKEIIIEAYKDNPNYAFFYTGKRLISDVDIIFAMMESSPSGDLDKVDKDLLSVLTKDRDFVLKLANTSQSSFLKFVDPSLRKDREIVLLTVTRNGRELASADSSLKKDKDIVLAAVKNDSWAFEYADSFLKNDKEVVLAAVKNNGGALQFADKRFRQDKNMVLLAIENIDNVPPRTSTYQDIVDPLIQKDPEILAAMFTKNIPFHNIVDLDELLQNEPKLDPLVLKGILKSPHIMVYASDRIKSKRLFYDKNYVLAMVKRNGKFIKYAGKDLKSDPEVIREAAKTYGMALKYAVPCADR